MVAPRALIRSSRSSVPLLIHAGRFRSAGTHPTAAATPIGTVGAATATAAASAGVTARSVAAAAASSTSSLRFRGGVRHVHRHALDDVIFAAERLRDLGVQESDEAEGAERLRYEDVRHLAELAEIVSEIVGRQVLGASAYEHFAGHLLDQSLLKTNKQTDVRLEERTVRA